MARVVAEPIQRDTRMDYVIHVLLAQMDVEMDLVWILMSSDLAGSGTDLSASLALILNVKNVIP